MRWWQRYVADGTVSVHAFESFELPGLVLNVNFAQNSAEWEFLRAFAHSESNPLCEKGINSGAKIHAVSILRLFRSKQKRRHPYWFRYR